MRGGGRGMINLSCPEELLQDKLEAAPLPWPEGHSSLMNSRKRKGKRRIRFRPGRCGRLRTNRGWTRTKEPAKIEMCLQIIDKTWSKTNSFKILQATWFSLNNPTTGKQLPSKKKCIESKKTINLSARRWLNLSQNKKDKNLTRSKFTSKLNSFLRICLQEAEI